MYQRSNLKPCKICLKPVNPEEKNCPYCGSKLKKDLLPKLIIGVLVLTLFGSLAIPTKSNSEKEREKIAGVKSDLNRVEREIETAYRRWEELETMTSQGDT